MRDTGTSQYDVAHLVYIIIKYCMTNGVLHALCRRAGRVQCIPQGGLERGVNLRSRALFPPISATMRESSCYVQNVCAYSILYLKNKNNSAVRSGEIVFFCSRLMSASVV